MSELSFPTLPGVVLESRVPFARTVTQKTDNGKQLRIKKRTAVGWRYTLDVKFLRESAGEHTTLFDFFAARDGSYDSFYYTDPVDNVQRRVHFTDDELDLKRECGAFWTGTIELESLI